MKAFMTGATGFIGGNVVRKLLERGDEVKALVRSPEKAQDLKRQGVELVQGDLSTDKETLRAAMEGSDAVFHIAAVYKVGIPAKERPAMYDSNVKGTQRVLDAAIEAGVRRIVYVSTVAVFGNTDGEVVDETYQRKEGEWLSYYDETKTESHHIAKDRIAKGAPIVIVQPGGVYGPGDHSELGNFIDQTRTGKLKLMMFPDLGLTFVHVDDVASGILLAHDKGKIGESYVLGGQRGTMRELVDTTAELSGKKAPKRDMPVAMIKMSAPMGPVLGKVMGFPPNFKELIKSSDGVTWWASDDKARSELGYAPRDLRTGLEQTLAAS